ILKAFEASQPSIMQGGQSAAQSQNSEGGVGNAIQSLTSLIQRLEKGRKLDPEELKKQLTDAHLSLLQTTATPPEEVPQLLAIANDLKSMSEKVDLNVDADSLRKLVDRLESFRVEMTDHKKVEKSDPELLSVDPAQAPKEFRERVRRYFEKLSND
ncbi:MAG: hypothetical protein ABIP97_09990, partial [Chthoniobacterales bacterium]